jgi:hypothetical protein
MLGTANTVWRQLLVSGARCSETLQAIYSCSDGVSRALLGTGGFYGFGNGGKPLSLPGSIVLLDAKTAGTGKRIGVRNALLST